MKKPKIQKALERAANSKNIEKGSERWNRFVLGTMKKIKGAINAN